MHDNDNTSITRYQRQLMLPGFSKESQRKLQHAHVLIVGCGGLGNPALLYLAGAGIGTISVIDSDIISESNLHRQIIFREEECGLKKVNVSAIQAMKRNSQCKVIPLDFRLDNQNIQHLEQGYDLVLDCTDNFETRYLLDTFCKERNTPLVYGAIYRYEGQVSVFHHKKGIAYTDLNPKKPQPGQVPNCETGGVLGPLAGIIGSMQAVEAIKIITGIGETLEGKVLIYDLLQHEITHFQIKKREQYTNQNELVPELREITAADLRCKIASQEDLQLIDVREVWEHEAYNIGGTLIPMKEIGNQVHFIEREKPVIIYCKAGVRSAHVIRFLQDNFGYTNLYNLQGGILSWQQNMAQE